ncbi:ATP-dependent helicase HrpB [Pantoea dispersa]|uniref:ATP-dependent helicase HrpB n=1 Tax=Pantoea dispersa TaxID=59814 RepID=A0A8E1RWF6_9GAMM|nr:ATP-dependent helicase HrpB [Pantoea dispersa]KTR88616.1 ATP-dependent helicase HrpB [Pantoea dispersa]KTS22734.1 ATP-dependent helicase HrpB [Pantoea dispersa]KTS63277.1 ATP-dependent helicase HrpB [Pantoea dispersa]KTS66534.1 ATP-dependent helicase HrpB [Pantoea dispersa]
MRAILAQAEWELSVSELPVSEVLPALLAALAQSPQVLLAAPTGAGKSTWLPLQLLQQAQLSGQIIMLEPRRLAARNVAQRLAEQLGEQPGETVGYRLRGENCSSAATRLLVVTEGILTRMLQRDPLLEGVSLVILDEFHERSLQADLALALLLDVQQGLRDDLKILLMSATLDNQQLRTLLPDAPFIASQGRSFPVIRRYASLNPQQRFEEAVAREVSQLLRDEPGSLLLFLPGVAEIERVKRELASRVSDEVDLSPLYGALSLEAQRRAILPAAPGRRKVVLATNIAETSLTIEGIRLVVDSALERAAQFDVRSGVTRLLTQRISQASMTQRAGRAGRLAPGICLHLLPQEQALRAAAQSEPEILTSDLASLQLDLLQWGCQDAAQLQWLDSPPARSLQAARQQLQRLGALDSEGRLSARGRKMAQLGSDPRLTAMLCAAGDDVHAIASAALLVAILEDPPRSGSVDLRDALNQPQPQWLRRARHWQQRLNAGQGRVDADRFPALLAAGFADRLAQRRGHSARYQLANGIGAMLDEHDGLSRYEWLIAPSLLQGASSADARMLLALPVEMDALRQQCPQLVEQRTDVDWDEDKGTLRAWKREAIGALILRAQPQARPEPEILHPAMLRWIREKGLAVLGWTPEAEQLRVRLQCAAQWLPEEAWPTLDDDTLLASLEHWLLPEMGAVRDLKGLQSVNLVSALLHLLTWSQRQRLDTVLPTHYTVPTGSRLPIRYDAEKPPALAVRMQEMFGEAQNPAIADGRVPLVLELLSPAHRPLQITRDLAAFWRGAYPEVQKEMKGRYPKHPWPDDPASALPTRRTKKYSS